MKEFVHGDFGRTQPNLGTMLGADCDILTLDVTVSASIGFSLVSSVNLLSFFLFCPSFEGCVGGGVGGEGEGHSNSTPQNDQKVTQM